jgi:outer membrane protein TolC
VTLSAERPELGNEPELLIGPGVALALPVGARRVERAAAAFELAAREAEHAALEAEVAQVVRSAAQRVRLAGEAAHQATRELVPAAERDLVRIRDARRLGRGDRSDELAAERGLLSARRVALEAGLAAALAEIELEQALGVLAPPRASPRLAAETARALP